MLLPDRLTALRLVLSGVSSLLLAFSSWLLAFDEQPEVVRCGDAMSHAINSILVLFIQEGNLSCL